MDITKFAIEKNRLTYTVLLVLIIAGIALFRQMRRAENPDFTVRIASVVTFFPGAGPEKVEELVTDKLEEVIKEIPELDYIKSESSNGVSIILVNIKEDETVLQPIWDNLSRKVERIKPYLPESIHGPYVNDEFGEVFGIIIGLTGQDMSYDELKEIAKVIQDDLYELEDVGKANIHGIQDERFYIEYDNEKLSKLNLSPLKLKQILESTNVILPSGSFNFLGKRVYLESTGNFDSIDDLKKTTINLPGQNKVVYLEDLVDIKRDYVDPVVTSVRINGEKGLAIAVSLATGGNIIQLGEKIENLVAHYRTKFPVGVNFDISAYEHRVADEKVNEFTGNLVQAVIVVILVMFLFLGFRTGLIVASLIPSTIIITFLIMTFVDIGLDKVSLASLIIALGMLVDNAIVMSELIMVKIEAGTKHFKAAIESAKELRIPLLTSTLTTSAAFLPIYLAEAMAGEMLSSLFLVVTIALSTSWILALTLIPLLCVFFIKIEKKKNNLSDTITGFLRVYENILLKYLKKPSKLFIPIIILLIISIFIIRVFIPKIYFPPSDRNLVSARIILPNGTDISETRNVVVEIENYLADSLLVNQKREEGITNWASFIGSGAPRYTLNYNPDPKNPKLAYLLINTSSGDNTNEIASKITRYCQKEFPGVIADVNKIPLGPPMKFIIEFRLQGKDELKITKALKDVKTKLSSIEGVRNIMDDWGLQNHKLEIKIDQAKAKRASLTSRDVALSLQSSLSGLTISNFREDDDLIPIVMRTNQSSINNIEQLESINIYSQATGRNIPLKQIADIQLKWEPPIINRRDGVRTYTVQAGLIPGYNAKRIVNEMIPWLDDYFENLGESYNYKIGGEIENSTNGQNAIKEKVPIAALIIVILLIGQFNSIRKSIIILLTIPLGLIGVSWGLLLLDSYMGFMTFLGIISLGGIIVNNAIVMIDRFQTEMDIHKKSPPYAIVDACRSRFRPIMLTTATTSLGVLPLLLGGGLLFESMAIAIMFGLIFSTILTLIFVPVLYKVLFKVDYTAYSIESNSKT